MKYLKSTLCIFLAAVIAFSALGVYASADAAVDPNPVLPAGSVLPKGAAYVSGDVDGNGAVNSADALVILNHSIGEAKIAGKATDDHTAADDTIVRTTAADVSKDGKINSTDALYILNFKVGNISGFNRENYNIQKVAGNMQSDPWLGIVIDAKGVGLVGYGYDSNAGVFFATGEGFQREFGYDETYDRVAVIATMPLDTTRIKFTYGGQDWMVQLWKGFYGFVMAGCEVGIYNRPLGMTSSAYNVVTLEYYVDFTVNYYYSNTGAGKYTIGKDKPTFTRSTRTWWFTAFTPSVQQDVSNNIPKMLVDCTMKFDDPGLYRAFVGALTKVDSIFANYTGKSREFHFVSGTNFTMPAENTVRFQWQ